MRINFFMLIIALAVCGLIFFGFYKLSDENMLYSIGVGVMSLFMLIPPLSMTSPDYPRGMVMVKVFSAFLFAMMLIANVLFVKFEASSTSFIIINGLTLCLWAGVSYGMIRAKQ